MQWIDRVGRRLKLRDLHIVLSVAQHGSMGRAATELAISQPAVSKAIADVEHTLKVKLFDRTPSGAQITQYGEALVRWGNAVFDDLRHGVKEIEHLADPTSGELRLGCTEPMSSGLVPAIISRLSRQYPKMAFHVMQGDPATLQSRLHVRDIELAIGRVPDTVAAEAFETKVLFQEPVFVTSRQNNKLTRRRKVSLAEIAGEAWSLPPPGAIGHSALKAAFDAAGLNMPRSTVVTFSLQMHCALMATGGYLGLLPGSMLHFNAKRLGLAVVPVDVRLRPGPAGIFRLRNRTISPVADIFMRSAQDVAQVLKLGMR